MTAPAHYAPTDRRPIASRQSRWAVAASRALAARAVSANAISVSGMLCGVGAGLALAATAWSPPGIPERALWAAGAALIQARLLCNLLDGMVAIERGVASPVGELYNEAPDRISDLATLVGLGYAATSRPELGYLAGTLAVVVAYVRTLARSAGAPQDFRGPMAKQQRMFLATLCALYMALAPAPWRPTSAEQGWSVPTAVLAIICVGCVITAARRLARAAAVLRSKPVS